jgi:hypothetical protein
MVTLKQVTVRANQGHYSVLRQIRDNGRLNLLGVSVSDAKGYAKCLKTLEKWGAVVIDVQGRYTTKGIVPTTWRVTVFGIEILSGVDNSSKI